MADNGWSNGICFAEPDIPKLLLLSLERVGVVDTPEYIYREYDSKGTLRCDMMIFVVKSTRYPDVNPWFISTTGFCFPDTCQKAARKPCDVCVWFTNIIFSGLLWDFSRLLKEEDAHGLSR